MPRDATTEEVAAALHVKPATVRKYAREHRIPFDTTPGGHRRFDIDEAVNAMRAESAPSEDVEAAESVEAGPYVRVPPTAQVKVSSVPSVVDHARVVAYDTADDDEVWGVETPVV
jgi:excisionase family DNA binding protein